jgi:carboxyl-terminal processing protease
MKHLTSNVFPLIAVLFTAPIAYPQDSPAEAQESGAQATEETRAEELPLNDIRVFTEVFHKIKRDYVETVNDKELMENAIRGMLAGLDPHSSYLDAEDYRGLQEGTTGEFGGLGLEVGTEDGFIKVIAPIDDTPAQRAGIQAGDLIIRLDDTPVKGMPLDDAIEKMRGDPGTPITLTIMREGEDAPLTLTVVRDIIKVASVRSRWLAPGFAYLRVSQFQAGTGNDLSKAILALQEKNGGKLQGAVLDLRNNPGGVLGAAVSVADTFLESGQIVYTEGRIKDAQLEFRAKPPDQLEGAPLVVLVNEGSASASEIVAGALQDHHRAIIMGRQTFGKGSVQTILPVTSEAALKLTTARYYTPSGRSIQAAGIKPDIVLDKLRVSAFEGGDPGVVTEANLTRHLENGTPVPEGQEDAPLEGAPPASEAELARTDYELYEALNLLKGMVLVQSQSRSQAAPRTP